MSQRKAFLLRINPALHDDLQRWAQDDLRSLNAQIEFILQGAVRRAGRSANRNEKVEVDKGSSSTNNSGG